MARWNSANVLQSYAGGRRLWHLSATGNRFVLDDEKALLLNEPAPPPLVGKDWHTLLRPKLNIAWLPADKVFFRAVQLPSSDPAELASMVELQLEKLSPLPVTHIVWSMHLLPKPDNPEALQTVLVIIAARSVVEEFLGVLEKEGFLTDRLESLGLEQFLAANLSGEGIWIFVGPPGDPALVVWWYGNTIQNFSLVTLPAGPERGQQLKTQLEQVAWAGEMEGWLSGPLKVHLFTDPAENSFWEEALKGWGDSVEILPATSTRELAALSAQRCGTGSENTNLLPPESADRYHQQFVDRIWMRSAVTVVALYIMGVLFYFGMLYVFELKADAVKRNLVSMGIDYTNSQRDIEQIRILKTREALKYAALDCWKAVAENLPESMTVDDMFFHLGRLELRGTVVTENQQDVGNFNDALRTATDPNHHEALFTDVSPPAIRLNASKGEWSFNCSLKGADTQ